PVKQVVPHSLDEGRFPFAGQPRFAEPRIVAQQDDRCAWGPHERFRKNFVNVQEVVPVRREVELPYRLRLVGRTNGGLSGRRCQGLLFTIPLLTSAPASRCEWLLVASGSTPECSAAERGRPIRQLTAPAPGAPNVW